MEQVSSWWLQLSVWDKATERLFFCSGGGGVRVLDHLNKLKSILVSYQSVLLPDKMAMHISCC